MSESCEEITLELLIAKAISLNANALEIEYKGGREEICVMNGNAGFGIASLDSSGKEACALRQRINKIKGKEIVVDIKGKSYKISVRIFDSFGEEAYRIKIDGPNK